eukprot:g28087.t1
MKGQEQLQLPDSTSEFLSASFSQQELSDALRHRSAMEKGPSVAGCCKELQEQSNKKCFWSKFLLLSLLPICALVVGLVHFLRSERETVLNKAAEDMTYATNKMVESFGEVGEISLDDLSMLVDNPDLIECVDFPETCPENLRKVQKTFLSMAQLSGWYHQIRYLNSSGWEVVRVNYRDGQATAVTQSDLQSKKNRYYFEDTIEKNQGEVFLSPMDLNIEYDTIEVPWNPVLRMGMPLLNSQGNKVGIVLINMFGQIWLQHIGSPPKATRKYYVINKDGYFLYHENQNHTFGFMCDPPNSLSENDPDCSVHFNYVFVVEHADAWGKIKEQQREDGLEVFPTEKGLYSSLSLCVGESKHTCPQEVKMTLVGFNPASDIYAPVEAYRVKLVWGGLVASLLWLFISFVLALYQLQRSDAQKRIQQSQEIAMHALAVKSQFLSNMSHEIRTPMNAVIGMTALLCDTTLTPEQQDYTDTIRTSGDSLLAIINDILDFSKLEAGCVELEVLPFDVRELIESCLDLVAPNARKQGLDLLCYLEEGVPPMLEGDATRIRQILVNLLSNAVKFTEKGQVVVHVAATLITPDGRKHSGAFKPSPVLSPVLASPSFTQLEQLDNDNTLEIKINKSESVEACQSSPTLTSPGLYQVSMSVIDTGIGIPQDKIPKLFELFTQVNSSITRKYGGTGLGLAISKKLAACMGGYISISSAVDKGSAFTLSLPMTCKAPLLAGHGNELRVHPELVNKKVFVVDDNPDNLLVVQKYFQKWGCQAYVVDSPVAALRFLRMLQESNAKKRQRAHGPPFPLETSFALHERGLSKPTLLKDASRFDFSSAAFERWLNATPDELHFDFGVLDMCMPEMNGVELAAAIRRSYEKEVKQLVMLSSVGFPEDLRKSQEQHPEPELFDKVLCKPVKALDLLNVCVSLVSKTSVSTPKQRTSTLQASIKIDHEMGSRAPLRILVAEDNSVNQKMIVAVLKRMGYNSSLVSDGVEALQFLEDPVNASWDVLLLDLHMPTMGGVECCHEIRRREQKGEFKKKLYIMALTASTSNEDKALCKEAGMDDFVCKPVHMAQLKAALLTAYIAVKGELKEVDVSVRPRAKKKVGKKKKAGSAAVSLSPVVASPVSSVRDEECSALTQDEKCTAAPESNLTCISNIPAQGYDKEDGTNHSKDGREPAIAKAGSATRRISREKKNPVLRTDSFALSSPPPALDSPIKCTAPASPSLQKLDLDSKLTKTEAAQAHVVEDKDSNGVEVVWEQNGGNAAKSGRIGASGPIATQPQMHSSVLVHQMSGRTASRKKLGQAEEDQAK